jgi:hypothetical protein
MGWSKTHDLAVKTGTYSKGGDTKNRYKNVGMVMTDDKGGKMYLLDRTFNPAGVPCDPEKDSIILSVFEVKDGQESSPTAHQTAKANGYKAEPELDDEIPF